MTWAVCSGSLCGSFTNTTATTATYNAPSPVYVAVAVSVTATSVADTTKSAWSSVVVNPAPIITTTSPANGAVGTAYSAALAAAGGTGTLTWSMTAGSLPANLSLSSSGVISGTPSATGQSTFTVEVTDSAPTPVSAQRQLSIAIFNGALMTITTTSLPDALMGVSYSAPVVAVGGTPPYTWSGVIILEGLTLNASTGVISGTPLPRGPYPNQGYPYTYNLPVTVTDSSTPMAQTVNQTLSIAVNIPPGACFSSGNEATLSGQYAFTLSGFNGTGFLAVAGAFTADGTGKITAGEADTNGVLGAQHASIDTTASSYSVGTDNAGCATIVTSFGTFTTKFALGAISSGIATKARMIEFDLPTSSAYIATGQILQQDPTSFSTGPSGSYAFSLVGVDSTAARSGSIGVVTATGGNFSNGEIDINDAGKTSHYTGMTGTYGSIDANGRGAGTLAVVSASTSHVATYMVSSSEIILVTTDNAATSGAMSGEMRQQSGTFSSSSLNAKAVFYFLGSDSSGADTGYGTLTGDGSKTAAVVITEHAPGGSNYFDVCSLLYTVAPNGRTAFSVPPGYPPNAPFVLAAPVGYLTSANTGFLLGMGQTVDFGELEQQESGPFTNESFSGTFFMATATLINQSAPLQVGFITSDGAGNETVWTDGTSTTSQYFTDPSLPLYFTDSGLPFTSTYSLTASDGSISINLLPPSTGVGYVISGNKVVLLVSGPSFMVLEK